MDNSGKLYLGHIGRVPLYAGFEALFLLAFVWMVAGHYPGEKIIAVFLVFLISIVLHELAHAVVALAQGMTGVSITISAMGGYCSYAGDRHPWRQALISIAGPVTNLFIAWGSYIFLQTLPDDNLLRFFVDQMLYWNLVLGILNILPIYPLDGGQVLLALSQMGMRRERSAKHLTLVIAVFTSAAGLLYLMHRTGSLPTFTLMLVILLLFTAFRDLRS